MVVNFLPNLRLAVLKEVLIKSVYILEKPCTYIPPSRYSVFCCYNWDGTRSITEKFYLVGLSTCVFVIPPSLILAFRKFPSHLVKKEDVNGCQRSVFIVFVEFFFDK